MNAPFVAWLTVCVWLFAPDMARAEKDTAGEPGVSHQQSAAKHAQDAGTER